MRYVFPVQSCSKADNEFSSGECKFSIPKLWGHFITAYIKMHWKCGTHTNIFGLQDLKILAVALKRKDYVFEYLLCVIQCAWTFPELVNYFITS